jgi:hypothetical protein
MRMALDHETVKRNLSNIHWPGDLAKLDPVLNKLSTLFESHYLHVDVGSAISRKIGNECKFPKRKGLWEGNETGRGKWGLIG